MGLKNGGISQSGWREQQCKMKLGEIPWDGKCSPMEGDYNYSPHPHNLGSITRAICGKEPPNKGFYIHIRLRGETFSAGGSPEPYKSG